MQPEHVADGRPFEVKDAAPDCTASTAVPDAARQPIVSERRITWQLSIMLDGKTDASDHAARHSITLAATSGHFPPDGGRPFVWSAPAEVGAPFSARSSPGAGVAERPTLRRAGRSDRRISP
ncbi:hypothetical protein TPA0908_59640 [Micromonospora sp. AKA38]|nr:hypothetical protein TPA0908_59640 [Micromonospora sp. AKA38]